MPKLQRYVSDELTHFVGRGMPVDQQYSLLIKILQSGWLTHPPHAPGISGNLFINESARLSENEMYQPEVVCFCDIPVHDLHIHIAKYSHCGLAFSKSFLAAKGANPVFYLVKASRARSIRQADFIENVSNEWGQAPPDMSSKQASIEAAAAKSIRLLRRADLFDDMINRYSAIIRRLQQRILAELGVRGVPKDLLELTDLQMFFAFNIFSFIKFFDHSLSDDHPNNYYMEREWRIVGNVDFTLADVTRVILPAGFARRLRADVPDYYGQLTFVE